ncbi:MAG: phosphomannomutase/phosphoglucomutase [Magnetococcales bacterium]|nr:phosphomannomutase/phosphoglucomutase [Magnetococcales bacterium]
MNMNAVNPYIFREYDIRGVMHQDLTPELFRDLGRVFAAHLRAECHRESLSVAVGRDGRHSSPVLAASLIEGLVAGGLDVTDVGLVPTPALYFATHHLETDAGIMITGSHNPPDHNGLKMLRTEKPIFGVEIQAMHRRLMAGDFPSMPGGRVHQQTILDAYVDRVAQDFRPGRSCKVVLDCGNGATGVAAERLLKRLPGIQGDILFAEIDGDFPNHHPDPTDPKNLTAMAQRMRETGAELGIAFDGDGDRIGVLDHTGRILWGDLLMILFAREILAHHPGATVIGDVKCSQLLFDAVAQAGGTPIMWKTGHSLIKDKMKETGAPLAGEMSGHLFFADRYFGFDDALYAAMRLLEVLVSGPDTLSARLGDLPELFSSPELRIPCPDAQKFAIMERVLAKLQETGADLSEVDGARVRLEDGWWLLRVSNTQPILVVRAEARSRSRLQEIMARVATILEAEGIPLPAWTP